MRHVIFLMLIAFAGNAAADDASVCKKVSALAGRAMEDRQSGKFLEDTMASVGSPGKLPGAIVMRAYASPIRSDNEAKQQEIKEFRNLMYAECYNASR